MKKRISILCIFLGYVFSMVGLVDAATLHSGWITSDETWTLAGSPHIINALTTVRDGATLTIEPGVEVRFNKDATNPRLIIGEGGSTGTTGKLIAQGTASQKIKFTSNAASPQPGDWADILFYPAASNDSIIEYAIIEYGGRSLGNIRTYTSNPTIKNCIIRKSLNAGVYIFELSEPEISGCQIEENDGYGIEIIKSAPVLDANQFINNGSYPIAINIGSFVLSEPVIYSTNTFSGNNPNQIYFDVYLINFDFTLRYLDIPYFFTGLTVVREGATLTIEPGVEVRFNESATNPRLIIGEIGTGTTGKLIAQGTASQQIKFTSNAAAPQPGDWADIYFAQNASDDSIIEHAILEYGGVSGIIQIHSSNPTIKNCIIRNGSHEGIYIIDSTSEVSCCDFTNNDIGIHVNGRILNNPTIINNNIFGNTTYGIQNTTPGYIVNAENNWWGHASGPGGVGPGIGDAVSAGVDYDPWLTEISLCTIPIKKEIIGTWDSGIWYYDVAKSKWTSMTSWVTTGDIAAGDITGDGRADVASCWDSGLWYQNGATFGWKNVYSQAPAKVAAGDITGDGRAEIIGTWDSGIWYYDVAKSKWTSMTSWVTTGDIAAGDITGDGRADVASCWPGYGLYYQNGANLGWRQITTYIPSNVAVGDLTGDKKAEVIGTFDNGIWYWNPANKSWKRLTESGYVTDGDIAAGDFTGDGYADTVSCWSSGLWMVNGKTGVWTQVHDTAPYRVTAGNVTGD